MKIQYTLSVLLLLLTGHVSAEQYAIHLDTSESADFSKYKDLSKYGELFTVPATQGLITTLIGPYEGKRSAGERLNLIRASGNYGAYIVKHKKVISQAPETEKQSYSKNVDFQGVAAIKASNRF